MASMTPPGHIIFNKAIIPGGLRNASRTRRWRTKHAMWNGKPNFRRSRVGRKYGFSSSNFTRRRRDLRSPCRERTRPAPRNNESESSAHFGLLRYLGSKRGRQRNEFEDCGRNAQRRSPRPGASAHQNSGGGHRRHENESAGVRAD